MTTYTATISFQINRVSEADCERFNKPAGTYELLDSYGDRFCFAATEEDAAQSLSNELPFEVTSIEWNKG